MFNPVQMWNYGSLFYKLGLSEKGRLYNDASYASLIIERNLEEDF